MISPRRNVDRLRVVLVGPLPPPPGGVASSIASIKSALANDSGAEVRVVGWRAVWKLAFMCPDIIHFNFSRPMKRFAGAVFGRLIGSRVVHTVHGNSFDFRIFGNIWAVRLSHGFIVLNADVFKRFRARGIENLVQLTPILNTDFQPQIDPNPVLESVSGKIALVYAHDRKFIDGKEVYGFSFIASLLPELAKRGYTVLFLDQSAGYSKDELDADGTGAMIHVQGSVDFRALLSRTSIYLRPTSTDGSSVAVLEALEAGVPVLASDTVSRPDGVITFRYGDAGDFLAKIDALDRAREQALFAPTVAPLSTAADYISFLRTL